MSEVILIGDRAVGKTSSVVRLIVSEPQRISITNISKRDILLLSRDGNPSGELLATSHMYSKPLEITADLNVPRKLKVNWVDTCGEWNQKEWQENSDKLAYTKDYREKLSNTSAIIVLLRPFRTSGGKAISDKKLIETNWISTEVQWCRRFKRWVEFISENCQSLQYVNFCLSKADLFCSSNLDDEADKIKRMGWQDASNYVYSNYFCPSNKEFTQAIKNMRQFRSVKFFITSTQNRTLLELPWLYLATHIKEG